MKRPKLLQSVALTRDIPEFKLRRGDSGVIVEVFEPDAVMVEFMDSEGDTVALLYLNDWDLRVLSKSQVKDLQHAEPLSEGEDVVVADATGRGS